MLSVVKESSRTVVADCRFTVGTGARELGLEFAVSLAERLAFESDQV